MSNWYIGQKVVCVDSSFRAPFVSPADRLLVKGRTYTILRIEPPTDLFEEGFDLCEIRRDISPIYGRALSYKSSRFRPIDPLTETMDRIESEGCPEEFELEPITT